MNSFPIEKFTSKSSSIFKSIPIEVRLYLENNMVDRVYRKGQNLFLEGSFPAGVYFLKEGILKKYKTDQFGKEHIIYLCTEGDLLGYPALLCQEAFQDSAAAIEIAKVGFISRDIFMKAVNGSNELMISLISSLSHEFGVMVNSVTVFAHMTVRERLALILLVLQAKFSNRKSVNTDILLSREDLANMVGTATETLVRLLQELKKEEIIELEGKKIKILNTRELVVMSKFY